MAVPKYNELMLPLLEYAGDGAEHSIQKASLGVAQQLSLTEDDINELLPSGGQTRYYNRFTWAKTYLTKAGLLMTTRRGHFQITDRGYNLLSTNPSEINNDILNQFSSFVEFQTASNNKSAEPEPNTDLEKEQTPEEQVDSIHRKLRKTLADELLDTVLDVSPRFFERLVVDLLLAMGYGSSLDSGEHLGQSNDGGIDGVIQEDKLGLDNIYLQAKRYARDNSVGRPAIQAFVGSLVGFGATKGVFITTSYFSEHAVTYTQTISNVKVILIDGQQLAQLMIEHNVGISVQRIYEIKQIDENYFPDA